MSPDRRKPRSDHARVPPPRSPPSSCVSVSALLPLDVVRGLGLQGYDLRGFRCNTLSLDTGFPTPQVHEGRARGTLGRRTSNSFFSAPLFLTASGREYHAGGGSSGSEECRPHNMGFDHLHQCPILPHFSLADRQGQHHSSVYNVDTLTCRRIKLDYCTEHGCTLFRWKAKGGRARRLSTGHVTNSMRPFILFGLQLVDLQKLTNYLKACSIEPTSDHEPQSAICSAGFVCRPIKSRGGLSKVPVLALREKSWQVVLAGLGMDVQTVSLMASELEWLFYLTSQGVRPAQAVGDAAPNTPVQ